MKTYKYLFFDVDNTLTRSRTKITPDLKELLVSLRKEVVIVSGARLEQILYQVDGLPVSALGQNGNHAVRNGEELWRDVLTVGEKEEIMQHVASIPRTWDVPDENDLIDDRGAQICYSLYGHNAPIHIKETFDPDSSRRRELLRLHPFVSDTLEVAIGGTTAFDYFRKGSNKGYNVGRFIELLGWDKTQAVYFGDMLFPGGNDESVIGVIDTIPVTDPHDTLEKLQNMK